MKKPIIGISGSMIVDQDSDIFAGYHRAYTNDDYIKSVSRAGGVPVMLPIVDNVDEITAQVELLDGLIMMGGHDVDPVLYGEEPNNKLGFIYPRRDAFDVALIKAAVDKKLPILGICRGHQILNVAFGGSLYQDLSEIPGCNLAHVQKNFCHEPIHNIKVIPTSKLAQLIGEEMRVNSFHHLAVKDIAPDFVATAFSNDQVIEAIEYAKDDQYIVGVQFHPEMMSANCEKAQNIFNGLIEEASKYKEASHGK